MDDVIQGPPLAMAAAVAFSSRLAMKAAVLLWLLSAGWHEHQLVQGAEQNMLAVVNSSTEVSGWVSPGLRCSTGLMFYGLNWTDSQVHLTHV